MEQKYDVIVPMTADNLPVFRMNVELIKKNLACRRILVIGAQVLEAPSRELGVEFILEDTMIEGLTLQNVKAYMVKRLGHEKRAGWYFQQFLKLAYAYVCKDEYYIVWDSDTLPLHQISHMIDGQPVFTKKEEMEPAYFATLNRLFNGEIKKCGDFSFICENMIMNVQIMREMLTKIMQQQQLLGETFWEKILDAVSDEYLPASGFSEFETYGNYVMTCHPNMYGLRTLKGMRNGAEFFGMHPTKEQLAWAAESYDTIAFERWSHHHESLGKICRISLIRKVIPLHVLVNAKKWISEKRSKG